VFLTWTFNWDWAWCWRKCYWLVNRKERVNWSSQLVHCEMSHHSLIEIIKKINIVINWTEWLFLRNNDLHSKSSNSLSKKNSILSLFTRLVLFQTQMRLLYFCRAKKNEFGAIFTNNYKFQFFWSSTIVLYEN